MTVSISRLQGDAKGDAVSVRQGLSTGLTVSEIRNVIQKTLHASLKRTGYEEISLLSLSAGDYSSIGPLLSNLMDRFESKRVAVSFPSLRIESVVGRLAEEVKRVRKTGFTIAPEAGTERLRKVINKELDEEVLFQGLSNSSQRAGKISNSTS